MSVDLKATLEAELALINSAIAAALEQPLDAETYNGHSEQFRRLPDLYAARDRILGDLAVIERGSAGGGPMTSHPGRFL